MSGAEQIAQSDAQPVGWIWCYKKQPKQEWHLLLNPKVAADYKQQPHVYEIEAIYTTPPSLPERAREALERIAQEIVRDIDSGKVDGCYISPKHSAALRKALATPISSSARLIEAAEWQPTTGGDGDDWRDTVWKKSSYSLAYRVRCPGDTAHSGWYLYGPGGFRFGKYMRGRLADAQEEATKFIEASARAADRSAT